MTPSGPAGTWTIVPSTCERDSFIVWKETATAMGLGTQTSLLRSLEGRGGGILISHCFLAWPTHSITSERAPCSVQFPGARQAIRPQRNFTSSHSALRLQATVYGQPYKRWMGRKCHRKQRDILFSKFMVTSNTQLNTCKVKHRLLKWCNYTTVSTLPWVVNDMSNQ